MIDAFSIPTMAKINKAKKEFTVVSTFSGCGGSSTGYKMAGLSVRYANEFVPAAQDVYRLNHPHTHLDTNDIRKVKAADILKVTGLKKGELDLFDGSPPCASFSTAGARDKAWGTEKKYSDTVQRTDDLFYEFVRLLKGLKPKTFVAENVTGLVKGVAQGYFVEIYRELVACGYSVKARVLNAAYLGVPQARQRIIFVGVRNDLAKMGFTPVHPKPMKRVIAVNEVLPNIVRIKNKHKNLLTYVPADIPSPTIVASDGGTSETAAFSCGGFVEDTKGNRRKYTIDELKKIFTFPADFKLSGDFEQQWERLGRSVPPVMMYHIAMAVKKQILIPYYAKLGKKSA